MKFRWLRGASVPLLTALACAPAEPPAPPLRHTVRIGIAIHVQEVKLGARGDWSVELGANGAPLGRFGPEDALWVRWAGDRLQVTAEDGGELALATEPLRVRPLQRGRPLVANGRRYRGLFEVLPRDTALTVVNVVGMEEYLYGVVPGEIGRLRGELIEAVKTQAIAARTYAYAHLERRASYGFDLFSSVGDQLYEGIDGEHPVATRAVEATRGQVLAHEGQFVEAFYSSTCGGHTEDVDAAWGHAKRPFLVGVRDTARAGEPLCAPSRHFRWREHWSREALESILRRSIPKELPRYRPEDIGELRDLVVEGRTRSGRAKALRIVTSRASPLVVADRIRWVLRRPYGRRPILRSTYFLPRVRRDGEGRVTAVEAVGGGNGHGIGMCQWGAITMAERGYTAEEILAHYYRGAQVMPADSVAMPPPIKPGVMRTFWPLVGPPVLFLPLVSKLGALEAELARMRALCTRHHWTASPGVDGGSWGVRVHSGWDSDRAAGIAAAVRLATSEPVHLGCSSGRWTVHAGARRTRRSAEQLASELASDGFSEAVVEALPNSQH